MTPFFNENYANIIQFISLPLETIGGILTCIELLRPKLADKIEGFLDNLTQFKKIFIHFRIFIDALGEAVGSCAYFICLYLIASGKFNFLYSKVGEILSHLGFLAPILMGQFVVFSMFIITGLLISAPYIVGYIISILISNFIKLLNKLSNGRALGCFGLLLAFLGILGEFYQVITLSMIIYGMVILFLFFLLMSIVLLTKN